MSGGFAKIYQTILRSSIWLEAPTTRIVWITMLVLADKHGFVRASVGGLAHQAGVTRDECVAALETLSAPDPDSQTPDNDGRRVERIEGGWVVLNHHKYREMRTEKQVKSAERSKQYREQNKKPKEDEAPISSKVVDSSIAAEEKAHTECDASRSSRSVTSRHAASVSASVSGSDQGGVQGEETKIPCPADLELNEAQAANLEMTAGCPRWAQKQIAAKFRGRYLADENDRRTLVAWRKGLNTATAAIWSDPKQRPKREESALESAAIETARAAADARKAANLAKLQAELDRSTKGAA